LTFAGSFATRAGSAVWAAAGLLAGAVDVERESEPQALRARPTTAALAVSAIAGERRETI
jgi:hypothetical protein